MFLDDLSKEIIQISGGTMVYCGKANLTKYVYYDNIIIHNNTEEMSDIYRVAENNMNNQKVSPQLSGEKNAFQVIHDVIDFIVGKYLFPLVFVSLFLCTFLLRKSFSEVEMIVWHTIDSNIIGNRPGRLFGLLAINDISSRNVTILMYVIYTVVLFFASFCVYLFMKKIRDNRKKVVSLFLMMLSVMILFYYFKFNYWDLMSLSLFISLTIDAYAGYFLLRTDKKWLAPILAAVAEFIDCRALIFLMPVILYVMFSKNMVSDDKHIRNINLFTLLASVAILVLAFVTVDLGEKPDSSIIDSVFTERYIEAGRDPETIDRTLYAFKFESYISVTPQELFGDTLITLDCLKAVLFEDRMQLFLLLSISLILIYDSGTRDRIQGIKKADI